MRKRICIVGAGGHGREILDVLRAVDDQSASWEFVGFVADDEPRRELLVSTGAPWLGTVNDAIEHARFDAYLVGIGDAHAREVVSQRLEAAGVTSLALAHPSATIGSGTTRALGSVVWPQASLSTQVQLGRHSHVNQAASVSHDVVIGDFVTVAPHATVCGAATLGDGSWVGAAACVLQGVTVGRGAVVGAGAVVLHDVPSFSVVAGVPARVINDRMRGVGDESR